MSDEVLSKKNNDDDVFKKPLPPNPKVQQSGGKDLLKPQSTVAGEHAPKKNSKAKNASTSSLPDASSSHSQMSSETDPVNEEKEVERRKLQYVSSQLDVFYLSANKTTCSAGPSL